MKKNNSIKKRFTVTLIVNIFKLFSGVIASTIVPRSLGPTNYGNYQFIFKIATAFRTLFSFGTNHAFFTYSSKNIKSGLMFKIYFLYLTFELLIVTVFILLTKQFNLFSTIYPDQILVYVLLVTVVEWLNFVALSLIQLGESKTESVLVQKANLWSQIFKIIIIIFLYLLGELTLFSFIIVNILTFVITSIQILFRLIKRKWYDYFIITKNENITSIKKYFYLYCSPLIIFTIVTFFYTFFERWFLQVISGSIQQAYFSIAFQWNSISLLFTSSILNIFWREISSSFGKKEIDRIKNIFPKTIKFTYFISSIIALYFVFNAKFLLSYFAGENYSGATKTLIIFSFYPLFQSVGQLTSSYFLATEQTKKYKNLGLISLISGIIGTYIVLAPKNFIIPGLALNSQGLAAKTVLLQIFFTNIYLFIISKQLSIKFRVFMRMQLFPIFISLSLATICFVGIPQLFVIKLQLNFIITSVAYFTLSLILIIMRPQLIGLQDNFIRSIFSKVTDIFKK